MAHQIDWGLMETRGENKFGPESVSKYSEDRVSMNRSNIPECIVNIYIYISQSENLNVISLIHSMRLIIGGGAKKSLKSLLPTQGVN